MKGEIEVKEEPLDIKKEEDAVNEELFDQISAFDENQVEIKCLLII